MFFSRFRRAFSLLTDDEKQKSLHIVALSAAVATLESVSVLSLSPFLYSITNPNALTDSYVLSYAFDRSTAVFGITQTKDFQILLGLASIGFLIFSASFKLFALLKINRFIEHSGSSLATMALTTYVQKPYSEILQEHSSAMTKTIIAEVDRFVMALVRPLVLMVTALLQLAFISTILLLVNFELTVIAALSFSALYCLYHISKSARIIELGDQLTHFNGLRHLKLSNTLGGIKLIKLTGEEQSHVSAFNHAAYNFSKVSASNLTLSQVPSVLIETSVFVGFLIISINLVASSDFFQFPSDQLPSLSIFAMAALKIKPVFQTIYTGIFASNSGASLIDNLEKWKRRDQKITELSDQNTQRLKFEQKLDFNMVHFRHSGGGSHSISNVSFSVKQGSSIGIVGATGAGKTTLLDLMLGLLQPSSGSITIDNILLTEQNLRSWQNNLSYVQQEIFLTNDSVSANIVATKGDQNTDILRVKECAKIAQLHEFINNKLPDGYQTNIGERGTKLSGGQRQRLAIARALYSEKPVLFLDEATSALDTVTEKEIMSNIRLLTPAKTVFIVTHRLSTIQHCDNIILLNNGKLSAFGSYNSLMAENALFKQLAERIS